MIGGKVRSARSIIVWFNNDHNIYYSRLDYETHSVKTESNMINIMNNL